MSYTSLIFQKLQKSVSTTGSPWRQCTIRLLERKPVEDGKLREHGNPNEETHIFHELNAFLFNIIYWAHWHCYKKNLIGIYITYHLWYKYLLNIFLLDERGHWLENSGNSKKIILKNPHKLRVVLIPYLEY